MRRIKYGLTALTLTSIMGSSQALAHTPLCACYDNGDGTVLCEGGFSDGSSASGIEVSVLDANGNALMEGSMNEYSEFEFDKPKGEYSVMFNAGPGHEVEISSADIVE